MYGRSLQVRNTGVSGTTSWYQVIQDDIVLLYSYYKYRWCNPSLASQTGQCFRSQITVSLLHEVLDLVIILTLTLCLTH